MSYARSGLLVSLRDWFSVPLSAENLMEKYIRSNDVKALAALYDRHGNRLYYYLLILSNADTAADVTQKTWLKVMENKHQYRANGKFESWLFTVGRNTLVDELRKHNRYQYTGDTETIVDENIQLANNGINDFHQLICLLPFEQKEAFSLQQEGFSLAEIAQICAVPQETIKTRLRYARDKLKNALESRHE
ncbi:RNA polymerase sigma factor [Alteromonas aestuariivivens]|uniref:RNA polymerase sigma factor n=1 Tax=Alteromonas aestuariivivens TaxID=1938339 RepID=A0A3D8M3B9_9ALTE|nr:sigma-70 family RNA polymerase sigma factor [Alteromonas aestuariivivens]RDV24090.1 RNA polymerase sigma factor [Alteromonas aestuariivivens]